MITVRINLPVYHSDGRLKIAKSRGLTHEFLSPAEWQVRKEAIMARQRCHECEKKPKPSNRPAQEGLSL